MEPSGKSILQDSLLRCKSKLAGNGGDTRFPWLVLISIVVGYLLIYAVFYFQIGLPSGSGLENKDWLAFLGGYLSFSGSLIISVMIYRQEKRLAKLTMKQSDFFLECAVEAIELADKDFIPKNQGFYIPTLFENSEEYSDRYFFSDYFEKERSSSCSTETKEEKTLILSTALFCSHDAPVLGVCVKRISLFRLVVHKEKEIVVKYTLCSKPKKDHISKKYNQLLLAHFLPEFVVPEYGEYELCFDIEYDAFEQVKREAITLCMKIDTTGIDIIDGVENPCIPFERLRV